MWLKAAKSDLEVFVTTVDLDTDANWDLADSMTFHLLAEAVAEGLVDIMLGGPPCPTWSKARFARG